MTLHVRTARVSYGGPDRLDVTRKTGDAGLFLAPSWAILRPVLDQRRIGQPFDWAGYVAAYKAEIRSERAKWDALLAREAVTLVCFCTDPVQCHRHVLRREILPALGAVDAGEVACPPRTGLPRDE